MHNAHARLDGLRREVQALRPTPEREAYANDPIAFARDALGLELDDWQARVALTNADRVILCCSRQAGKSTTSAVMALHEALYHPGSLTLLVSPSLRQSSELFRTLTGLRHRLPWDVPLSEENRLSMTVSGGGRVVSLPGSESTIRGFSSVTLLIEDEAARIDDALHYSVQPMLAVARGRLVMMSSPFGQRGIFHHAWTEGGDTWHRERVTIHDVPRIEPEWIEEQRNAMPDMWFRSEYLAEFVEAEDALFGREYLEAALSDDVPLLFEGAP